MTRSALALAALSAVTWDCSSTPKQVGDTTREACTLISATAQDATIETICALAPELAEMAAFVAESREDAGTGAKKLDRCNPIPKTTVCATNAETLAAIRVVKARKK